MGHILQETTSARSQLRKLLHERNSQYYRKDEIDKIIVDEFERVTAIFTLDMCGFTRTALRKGIIHYLAMIEHMENLATPAIEDNGGTVIKQEADNIFAIFPSSMQAIEAAKDVFRSFDAANSVLPEDRKIFGSIGIGYGPTLIIGDEDLFGNEMNLACKLGEDLGAKAEILLTENAYNSLPPGKYQFSPLQFGISGVDFKSYRLEY